MIQFKNTFKEKDKKMNTGIAVNAMINPLCILVKFYPFDFYDISKRF